MKDLAFKKCFLLASYVNRLVIEQYCPKCAVYEQYHLRICEKEPLVLLRATVSGTLSLGLSSQRLNKSLNNPVAAKALEVNKGEANQEQRQTVILLSCS